LATADALVSQILVRAFWPASGAPLTSAELLSLADAEILGTMWPDLIAAQGNYYLATLDHDITSGYARYRLPSNAYGPIKDVLYIPDGGTDDDQVSLPAIDVEELGHYRARPGATAYVHFIDGDFVGLAPVPTVTQGTLRIRYYRAPSALCLSTSARQIATVTSLSGGQFTGSTLTTLWSTSSRLDIVSAGNAHQVLAEGLTPTSVSTGAIDFSDDLTYSGAAEDDWLCTTNTTPLVQVPDSMIPYLAWRTACTALSAHGDTANLPLCLKMGEQLGFNQRRIIEPRSEAEPRSVNTSHSTLWTRRTQRRGAW
jgi:hypothetical protein